MGKQAPRVMQPAFPAPATGTNRTRRRANAHHGGEFHGNDVKESAERKHMNVKHAWLSDSLTLSKSGSRSSGCGEIP